MEQMIEQAIRLGLKKLCFTDHMDYDYPHANGDFNFEFDIQKYLIKLSEMKEKYHSELEILTGVELGLQPHLAERMTSLTTSCTFDFIIGSTHVVDRVDPYLPEYWEDKTEEQGIYRYFETIIENCKSYDGFHVYGHIDYVVRYTPSKKLQYREYSYDRYADVLEEALKTILSKGKGIEVNTAGFKYGLGHPHPKIEVLKRYKELGGEIITLGSDAHQPEHLAYDFERATELLKSLGYRYYATFVQGKPVMEKL